MPKLAMNRNKHLALSLTSVRAIVFLVVATVLWLAPTPVARAITNGTLDGSAHPYVGVLTPDFVTGCSGALVTPTVFVTAGHCVTEGERVFVTTAPDAFSPAAAFVTGTAHPDPEFACCGNALSDFFAHDVAVVTLDSRLRAPRYAQLPQEGLADTLRQGQELKVVGYGAQVVVPSTKALLLDGKRYQATVAVSTPGSSLDPSFIKLSANAAQGKGGTCYGDSGGPDLLGDTMLAVNSFLPNLLCTGVTYGYRIDQSTALAFVRSFTR